MDIKSRIERYAPARIEVDPKLIDSEQKKLIDELVEAARLMDEIFIRQVWDGNAKLRDRLAADKNDKLLSDYFNLNAGPYDRLNHDEPFIEGVPPKPAGAAFYPADLTKDEFESWLKSHPKDREAIERNITFIKRDGKGLKAVPYSEEYREWLKPAADHLRNAAKHTKNAGLKKFLESRADAFLSNDYFASDVDWVRIKDHDIEVVIGPYEVYEDNLFGYKAAFEAVITRVDPDESKRLAMIEGLISDLEKHLPVADEHKGIGRSLTSPLVVTQEIYTSGDSRAGVQTLALNLPNDEKVRKQEGSKKVMFKNVQHAKFDKILTPIALIMMRKEDADAIGFGAFFAHTILHEVSHGIGPGEIVKNGEKTTAGRELKELYTVIEECKADALGAYNNAYLIEKGIYPKDFRAALWSTYLAGIFRSIRFGIAEAHGGSNAIQLNYILENGGFTFDASAGQFGVNESKVEGVVRDLARDVIMLEATGDYSESKKFVEKYRVVKPDLKKALERLSSVPVDIRPSYAYK